MKRLPFTLSTALVLLSFVGAPALAAGQTSGGPSLADTLQFITATVAAQGPVSFSGVVHDPAANTSWSYSRTVTLTNFVADAAACKLSFHFSEQTPGNPNTETDGRLPFSGIQQVKVEKSPGRTRRPGRQSRPRPVAGRAHAADLCGERPAPGRHNQRLRFLQFEHRPERRQGSTACGRSLRRGQKPVLTRLRRRFRRRFTSRTLVAIPPASEASGRGGIGRRAALRSLWGNPWKFESSRPHQPSP